MKVRLFFSIAVLLFLVSSCDEEIHKADCNAPVQATLRDLTKVDGYEFVFELQDGTRLTPLRFFYCGTPPLPKEVTEDPLYNFEFVDGKKVKIGYEECEGCNPGVVKITCIEENQSQPTTDRL